MAGLVFVVAAAVAAAFGPCSAVVRRCQCEGLPFPKKAGLGMR